MVKPTLKTGEMVIINPQIASKANIDSMQVVLEHVVSRGLGKLAGTSYVGVAGKTGTSQVGVYYFGEETSVEEYLLIFCGYFPADAPKYSIIVSLNKLGLPASGGGMAGVLFHNIVEWMITHQSLLRQWIQAFLDGHCLGVLERLIYQRKRLILLSWSFLLRSSYQFLYCGRKNTCFR